VRLWGRADWRRARPEGDPLSVQADPQREPYGAGELRAFLRNTAMRDCDFAAVGRKPGGEGLTVFQLVVAGAEINGGRAGPGLGRRSPSPPAIGKFASGKLI